METLKYPDVDLDEMDFPRTLKTSVWNQYLAQVNIKIGPKELHILESFQTEIKLNNKVKKLFENSIKHKLGILGLTNLYGNCLFESLELHKFIDNVDTFREDMAFLLYSIGDIPNFFPNQPETIKTLFPSYNEVEIVQNQKTGKYYKYTYDLMCMDLASDKSWTRLNTELLFFIMSQVFGVYFVVVNVYDHNKVLIYGPNNDFKYVDKIPEEIYELDNVIYLGLLGEVHYIPLYYEKNKEHHNFPIYTEARDKFVKWAKHMYFLVNFQKYKHIFEELNK